MAPTACLASRWPSRRSVNRWYPCHKLIQPGGPSPFRPKYLPNRVILATHLANLSYRTGKKIFWDADRKEVIGS
ncbi:Myo-inositol 2-dehydrogenase [Fimbriiglobus ruber]|uniref:Myo-inositol 2-dehydrogenase n=1 Tax=Fimbriiglobus ruber TaxID=1908690 RepID=A0A225DSV1_9BACT|nr:hypothetical protein [Fimbriiglobus ruber]OWK41618.1 Myo-inositol 2-dehydrogenase [Fimbriiglobus ruber]